MVAFGSATLDGLFPLLEGRLCFLLEEKDIEGPETSVSPEPMLSSLPVNAPQGRRMKSVSSSLTICGSWRLA